MNSLHKQLVDVHARLQSLSVDELKTLWLEMKAAGSPAGARSLVGDQLAIRGAKDWTREQYRT